MILSVEPPFVMFASGDYIHAEESMAIDASRVWKVEAWDASRSQLWILGKQLNQHGVDEFVLVVGNVEDVVAKIMAARKAAK